MARFTVIKVGKSLNVDHLRKKPTPRERKANPRDEDLAKLVNEVAAGLESQVLPWEFDGKLATARLVAARVIKRLGSEIYVSSRADHPGVLVQSRAPVWSPEQEEVALPPRVLTLTNASGALHELRKAASSAAFTKLQSLALRT